MTSRDSDARTVEELSLLEPFGKGNTKPIFAARDIELSDVRVIGKNKNVIKALARDKNGTRMDALYFGDVEKFLHVYEKKGGKMMLTYYPGINEYLGQKKPQITITHYQ